MGSDVINDTLDGDGDDDECLSATEANEKEKSNG